MPPVTPFQVTFDCVHPVRVARFWCEVLGYVEEVDPDEPLLDDSPWAACVDPTGVGPRLFFQRVPEGKVVKNRVHLDVRAGAGLVGEERLAKLNAEGGPTRGPRRHPVPAAAGRRGERVVPDDARHRGQ